MTLFQHNLAVPKSEVQMEGLDSYVIKLPQAIILIQSGDPPFAGGNQGQDYRK